MNEHDREWKLDSRKVDELYEYKNLWVTRNCFSSSPSNIDTNIEKTTAYILSLLLGTELLLILCQSPQAFNQDVNVVRVGLTQ